VSITELEEKRELLNSISFFKAMCEEDQNTFLKNATLKNYPKHTSISVQGDKADKFLIIIKGWVKLYNVTIDGKEIIATLLTKDDVLGEDFLFSHQTCFFPLRLLMTALFLQRYPPKLLKK